MLGRLRYDIILLLTHDHSIGEGVVDTLYGQDHVVTERISLLCEVS